jgi:uncharacterized membrane protein YbhN (UPF0104 family)
MKTFNNNPNQTIWEIWFVSAIIILLTLLFIGTVIEELCDNQMYINLLIIAFINTISAIIIGLNSKD